MYAIGPSYMDLIEIAVKTGVGLVDIRDGRKKNSIEFRLCPHGDLYRRVSMLDRRVNAVCFHGHYEFMWELFQRFPNAELGSMYQTFHGKEEFEKLASVVADEMKTQRCKCEVKK